MRRTTRVYVDSNVLIDWTKNEDLANRVFDRIRAKGMALLSSHFLRMEVEPMRWSHGPLEKLRVRTFFGAARHVSPSTKLADRALGLCKDQGLSPLDALHVAAAEAERATWFVSIENKRRKPMHHATLRGTAVVTPEAFLYETL